MREWTLYVCRSCGDYSFGGWEEVVHIPNVRCPGRREPQLVEQVTVVPKRDALALASRARPIAA